jgi:hypothetical protein
MSKFDRTPSETRLPPEDRRNTNKRASKLDSRSRRDKREKEKKRKDKKDSKPLRRKPSTADSDTSSSEREDTHAEEASAISVSQIGGRTATRKGKPGNEALDNPGEGLASIRYSVHAFV